MKSLDIKPVLLVDTREPLDDGWEPFFQTAAVRSKLDSGDYSIVGCGEMISAERKTLDDLIGCLTSSRERFTSELQRGQRIQDFCVIVEAGYYDLMHGEYRSAMSAKSAWESVIALEQRYRIPFYFAGHRKVAAALAESILLRWWKNI